MVTVLSTLTLFLDCAGFLATGVVLGITRFPSVEVTVVGIIFLFPKEINDHKWLHESMLLVKKFLYAAS